MDEPHRELRTTRRTILRSFMNMRALIHITWMMLIAWTGQAQDGKLISAESFALENSVAKQMTSDMVSTINAVEMTEITYLSDNLEVKGFVLTPRAPGKYPVMIFNRGTCNESGAMTRAWVSRWLTIFASWGYVVVASQYRGAGGGQGKDEFGGADVNDVINLMPLIDSLPKADPSRIGMYGWSRGGLMTYLALTQTDRLKAAVIGGAPTDLAVLPSERKSVRPEDDFENFCMRGAIPGYDRNRQDALDQRSPIRWPAKLTQKTPILLMHGSSDWRVPVQHAMNMASALIKLRHPVRLVIFEGGSHEVEEHLDEVDRLTRDWFDRYVRDGQAWPSTDLHGQ